MKLRSLQSRLAFGLGISLLVLIACAWVMGHEALHRLGHAFVLSRLQHDAEALVAALKTSPEGGFHVGQRRLTPVYRQPYSGHYFVLAAQDQDTLYSRSLWDQTLEIQDLTPGKTAQWRVTGPAGQDLLVWSGGYRKQDLDFTVAVAEDISPYAEELRGFEWILSILAGGGVLLLFLVQKGLITQAFRKLQPVYDDIERLERGDAVALTEDLPDEVLPLVRKLNNLLEQYRQRLERSRRATGNLAHALKTPLHLLVQQLEHNDPPLEPERLNRLNGQVNRIRQLMERELKRARFAGAVGPGQWFHPEQELPMLVRLLEGMHPEKTLRVQCRIDDDGVLQADREDMLELIGNLLDNASKWAASRVSCQIGETDNQWQLTVEDDGPGCSDEELAQVSSRGIRLDESISGHGLGLSIVEDIVALYKGHIHYGRSESLGGFSVRVNLPLHPTDPA